MAIQPRMQSWSGSDLSIRVLDEFAIARGDGDIPNPEGRRVLAFLALHPRPLRRAYVAGSLWLDKNDARAQGNLRQVLCRLNQVEPGIVRCRGDCVELAPSVSVDLRDATALARRLTNAAADLSDADLDADLLSGELLPGWHDDWVVLERERFHLLRSYALEHICLQLVARGYMARAVEVGFACVASDPLRESAQRALVSAFRADGNWSNAVRQYRHYESILAAELGLRPTAAMCALVADLIGCRARR